jgi:hypothetical protein
MMFPDSRRLLRALLVLAFVAPATFAADWSNSGGNAERNGQTSEIGPDSANVLWSGGRPSIIAWQPVIEAHRVFMVRQTSFPPETTGSPVVCQSLDTGAELWAKDIPANAGDWTAWVAGVSGGRVYAARSGNGASVAAKLYCLDATNGNTLWISTDLIDAGAYDGVVFAPNGDPVVASFRKIWRINHLDGTTVWSANRLGSVSGNCGGAIHGNGVFVADAAPGGNVIKKYDLTTGAFLYQSPLMSGFLIQNTPMVGPDGTVYLSRVQNNVGVDFFFAFADSGAAFTQKWSVAAGYSTSSEFAVGPGGSVYHVAPNNEIHQLDPATGATLGNTGPIPADFSAPRIAVDAQGRVFLSNGAFSNGAFYSFNADLSPRWSIPVPNVNIGAPAIGAVGTLIVAGIGTNVTAYRTSTPTSAFCLGDGTGTACPCGNSGAVGRGCANSIDASGALIGAIGTASVSADSFVLQGSGMPNSSALYFQGTSQLGGGLGVVFGDGLRCAGGTVVRLGTKSNVAGASQYPAAGDASVSVRGLVPALGGTRTYQIWYRNAAAFCTSSTFNLSNGLSVTWGS